VAVLQLRLFLLLEDLIILLQLVPVALLDQLLPELILQAVVQEVQEELHRLDLQHLLVQQEEQQEHQQILAPLVV
jgi:hypothetical protein